MKAGQVYVCPDCGVELKVVKECTDCAAESSSCSCEADCQLACCGKALALKR
jgi:hypothetical protein